MWNSPTKKQLEKIPALYFNEDNKIKTKDQKIHMHFFIGGCDWWVSEYDPETKNMFGFCCLNDTMNAEWGYVSLNELKDVKIGFMEVDKDKHWTVRPASEVKEIVNMCSWLLTA